MARSRHDARRHGLVADTVRDIAWTLDRGDLRRLTPEGLYGRWKMTALIRRRMPDASPGSGDLAMRTLGLQGIRTTSPSKDGKRAGDLLDRDFAAAAPNRTWVMDFTYARCWTGWVYAAFVVDVYAQEIGARNAATTIHVDLVMTPIRMATWQRNRDGDPVVPGQLIGHADAGPSGPDGVIAKVRSHGPWSSSRRSSPSALLHLPAGTRPA